MSKIIRSNQFQSSKILSELMVDSDDWIIYVASFGDWSNMSLILLCDRHYFIHSLRFPLNTAKLRRSLW